MMIFCEWLMEGVNWIERALEDAKGEVSMAAPSHNNVGDALPVNPASEMERQSPNADDTGCQRDSGSDITKEENNREGDTWDR